MDICCNSRPSSESNVTAITGSWLGFHTLLQKTYEHMLDGSGPGLMQPAQTYDAVYPAGSCLRFGDKVCLQAHPASQGAEAAATQEDPLFLYSQHLSPSSFAQSSRHQVVGLTDRAGAAYDTVWQVGPP